MGEYIGVAIAEEATKNLIKIAWGQIQYLRKYDDNINKLKEKVEDLECKKGVIKQYVDECKRNGEEIRIDVLHWFEKVDTINENARKLLEKTNVSQRTSSSLCCARSSLRPPISARYKLSKEARNKISDMIQLQNRDFPRVGYVAPPGQMSFISPKEFHGVESHTKIMSDILLSLNDNAITRIGICGPAGVGKTTLVKKIGDDVKANKLFDEVVLAVVSRDPIEKVQDQLAESLGLKLEDHKTSYARADRLCTRLMDKKKKVLIILDDLWKELDLHRIGIPERGGLTVVFTTRLRDVCSGMGCRRNRMSSPPNSFDIPILSEDEAWALFKKAAKISDDAVEQIAKKVAERCGRLPLAIMVIGKTLRDKREHAWRDALEQLTSNSFHVIDDVHSRIKWSYDYLQNVQSKKLLLLCALFPEDYKIPVEDLVRYAKGLQLFRVGKKLMKSRDRVWTIVDELKNCYLLLPGYDEDDYVKLHDVVREVCLSIASSGEEVYKVMHTRLKKWPEIDCATLITCISLTFDHDHGKQILLPNKLCCPNLKLLRLVFRRWDYFPTRQRVNMHDDFFQEMEGLQVLEITNLCGKVPSSLKSLANLQILSLIKCILAGDISSVITSLNKLEMIDLHDSSVDETSSVRIDNHATGHEHLEFLDLLFKKGPSIASDFLMRLNKLEELYLGDNASNYLASTSGDDDGVFINLQKLVIYKAHQLQQLSYGNLPSGSFVNLTILDIRECPLISSLFLRSSMKCFQQLKRIITLDCSGLEVIIHDDDDQGDEGKGGEDVDLPKLQHLEMKSLRSFKGFDIKRGALVGEVRT